MLEMLPSASKFGVPVVSVTRGAWMNEQPAHVMPAGFATISTSVCRWIHNPRNCPLWDKGFKPTGEAKGEKVDA